MKRQEERELRGPSGRVFCTRTDDGVPVIESDTWADVAYGLGWCHARDRFSDTVLLTVIGRGQAAETLMNRPEFVAMDSIFRRWDMWRSVTRELKNASPDHEETVKVLEAYSSGFNAYRAKHGKPWEWLLFGLAPPLWTPAHSLLVGKVMGYLGLAQGQEEVERFIIDAIHRGTDRELLTSFFAPHLEGLDYDLVKKVIHTPLSPIPHRTPPRIMPMIGGSNNWVLSPKKSASGNAILCNDPHLEINRLPPVWYEAQIRCGSESVSGVTFPGIPGVLIGRNHNLSFGVTYTMADTTDFWIHECKGGRVLLDGSWKDFTIRQEKIYRRRSRPLDLRVYELPDGSVLDSEPVRDGYYLSLGWSGRNRSSLDTLSRLIGLNRAKTVKEGTSLVGGMAFPALNWLFADDQGDIGFQVGGSYPRRVAGWSGLYPIAGWKSENRWQGFLEADELPSESNPSRGFITTANNDVNQKGKPIIVNLPLPSYRVDRIAALLKEKKKLTLEDMEQMHKDVHSLQAESFLKQIEPLLGDSLNAKFLREWDFQYSTKSYAPCVFENIYRELVLTVFGDGGFGRPWLRELVETTPIGETISNYFDRTILSKQSAWLSKKERDSILGEAIARGINKKAFRWGQQNRLMMNNILFDGRLPAWLGVDYGPVELPGGRATVCQGNIFNIWGRTTSFAPSYRFITDMGEQEARTVIPGGFSGRPRSPWYTSDLARFLRGGYKKLKL